MKITPKLLREKINEWRKILDIEKRWKINFVIRESPLEMSSGHEDSMACISVMSGYFIASLEVNSLEILEKELDATILHELLHILIDPLSVASDGGLGKAQEALNSIIVESTIERLMPGYLYLYNKIYKKSKYGNIKKNKKYTPARTRVN